MSLFKNRMHFGRWGSLFRPPVRFSPNLELGPPPSKAKCSLDAKFASGLESQENATASSLLFSACQRRTFIPPPKRPRRNSRWLPYRPADRTSIGDANSREPLFLEVSWPLTLLLPPWRPARDCGKPGHRPGPEWRRARPPIWGDGRGKTRTRPDDVEVFTSARATCSKGRGSCSMTGYGAAGPRAEAPPPGISRQLPRALRLGRLSHTWGPEDPLLFRLSGAEGRDDTSFQRHSGLCRLFCLHTPDTM